MHGIVFALAQDIDLAFGGRRRCIAGGSAGHALATRPGAILAENIAQDPAHLSYGGIGLQRGPHGGQQILAPLRGPADFGEPRLDRRWVPLPPQPLESLNLIALVPGTDLPDFDRLLLSLEAFDTDNDA